ncbi:MAG: phosphate uptake regulator PhoU [Candidatus Woesearchaeota archaeon]
MYDGNYDRDNMEYRKIIEFGKSSFVMSLPKDWLKENNIKKGDVVYLNRETDKLVVYPADNADSKKERKITIDVTDMTLEEIGLQLSTLYIRNFTKIILTADSMKLRAKDIRLLIHELMALEVIEEDASKIVTRAFINMDDISPLDLLEKMDIITREMIVDSKTAFNEDKSENIYLRDLDVNRLSLLLFRSVRYLQKNPDAARKKNISYEHLLAMWDVATKVEEIADQAKRLAKLMRRVKLHKDEEEEFYKLFSSVEKYYHDTMEVFNALDKERALKLAFGQKRLVKKCRDFYRQNWDHEWVPVLLEKLKTTIAACKSISMAVGDMDC